MASIRNLKKDINNVLGDVIEAVYIVEQTQGTEGSKEGTAIIDDAIAAFDRLIGEVHRTDVDNQKSHFKQLRQSLETEATALVERINKLA